MHKSLKQGTAYTGKTGPPENRKRTYVTYLWNILDNIKTICLKYIIVIIIFKIIFNQRPAQHSCSQPLAASQSPGGLVKRQSTPPPSQRFWLRKSGTGLRICIPNTFPGDAALAMLKG